MHDSPRLPRTRTLCPASLRTATAVLTVSIAAAATLSGCGESKGPGESVTPSIAATATAAAEIETPVLGSRSAISASGLTVAFLGQDGHGGAGRGCSPDETPDNLHIRLTGLPADKTITTYEVVDLTGSGLWVYPCNDRNWSLLPLRGESGSIDLYLKPHRDAPDGAPYRVSVTYDDGTTDSLELIGGPVLLEPELGPTAESALSAEFLGQDGGGFAGQMCTEDSTPDDIHIRLQGLPPDAEPDFYQVDDYAGGGRWVYPCNDENWWLLPKRGADGTVDLYFQPVRDAPEGSEYIVTVHFDDGTHQRVRLEGSPVGLTTGAQE